MSQMLASAHWIQNTKSSVKRPSAHSFPSDHWNTWIVLSRAAQSWARRPKNNILKEIIYVFDNPNSILSIHFS